MTDVEEIQQMAVENKVNPHAAILARHAARKNQREKEEREEQERLQKLQEQIARQEEATQREREAEEAALREKEAAARREKEAAEEAQRKVREQEEREEREQLRREKEKKETEEEESRKFQAPKIQKQFSQQRLEDLLVGAAEPRSGLVQRYEGALKGWKSRFLVVEDKLPLIVKVYKQAPAEGEPLETFELTSDTQLEDEWNVFWGGHSSTSASTIASKKSSKSKENVFLLTVKDRSLRLSADTNASKTEWVDYFLELLMKHHGMVHSVIPVPDSTFVPPSPAQTLKKSVSLDFSGSKLDPKKRSKSSVSIASDYLIDPFADDIVGQSFRNELFGK